MAERNAAAAAAGGSGASQDGLLPASSEAPESSNTTAGSETPNQELRDKVKALLPTLDGSMVVAYRSGILDHFTELGRLNWTRRLRTRLTCGVLVANLVWLGGADGYIRVYDTLGGEPRGQWPAHMSPVKAMAVMRGVVYSMGKDGSIRGWPAAQPPAPAHLAAWKVRSAATALVAIS